jgi:hypothetical protein
VYVSEIPTLLTRAGATMNTVGGVTGTLLKLHRLASIFLCDSSRLARLSTARIQGFSGFKDSAQITPCNVFVKHPDSRPMGRQARLLGRNPLTNGAPVPTLGARLPTNGAQASGPTPDVDVRQESAICA